jgi:NAD-dependent deacetylase
MKQKIVVLTGAGISAESGIQTFRGAGGLWNGYNVMEVASIDGWHKNPKLVLDFYNLRRADAANAQPNLAHTELARLEQKYDVTIITQNVDDLHERGGSTKVIHLHGKLREARSTQNDTVGVRHWS